MKNVKETAAKNPDIAERKRKEEEASRMVTVVRDSNDAIIIQDIDGRINAWNHGAELIFGYSEEDALQMKIWQLAPPNKAAEQKDFNRRIFAGEKVSSFETQRLTKDGRLLDIWLTITKLMDDAGKVIGIASTERDITERKRAEEAILREKQFADTVIDSMPGVFYLIDEKGRFVRLNKNMSKVTGYSSEELLRFKATDIIAEEDRDLVAGKIGAVFKKGYENVEAHLLTKDMRKIPYYFTGIPAVIGDKTYLIGMGIDVTERKK